MRQEEKGVFYGLGRGIFIALIAVTLPAMGVAVYYDQVNKISADLIDLPVFDEVKLHFMTGVELVGRDFGADLRRFYLSDSLSAPAAAPAHKYWERPALNRTLSRKLSRKKQSHKEAYLDYIDRYSEVAVREMRRTKIPASITLAQGLFESDAGRGFLAREANNHFGIKCRLQPGYRRDGRITRSDFDFHGSLAIDCVQRKDDYVWDHFEVYNHPANSFRRHSILLQGERYNWMIRQYEIGSAYDIPRSLFGRRNVPYYAAWAVGLKSSGYATAKNYAEQITAIIETYELWKIDYEAVAQ